MREPQPTMVILIFLLLGTLTLALWWLSLPWEDRHARLTIVAHREQAAEGPPPTLVGGVQWLLTHRLGRLRRMLDLFGVAAGAGFLEGWDRRKRDPFGGFAFFRLALGHVLLVLTFGGLVAYLLLPWPVPAWGAGGGLSLLLLGATFHLAAGRPLLR